MDKLTQKEVPKETKIVFSGDSTREDLVDRLVEELRKHMRMDEQIKIATRLLSHPEVEEPPELVDAFGEYQAMAGKGLLDSTKKQNWIMARDEYFNKTKPEEEKK